MSAFASWATDDHDESAAADMSIDLLLSRIVGTRKGRDKISDLLRLVTAAWPVGRTSWPSTATALHRHHGSAVINELWDLHGEDDCLLPRDVVEPIIPSEARPAFWQFVAEGPAGAFRATDKVLRHWAAGRNLDGTPRERLSSGSIKNMIGARHRLAKLIVETREAAEAPELAVVLPVEFAAWTPDAIPQRKTAADFNAVPANRDKPPPPLLVFRRALKAYDRFCQARARKGAPSIWWLRRRALLGILALGPRAQTVAALRAGHVIERHHFGGDTYGPALLYTVLKDQPGVTRYQGIPDLLFMWIREYADFVGITDIPDAPLFRTKRTTDRPDQTPKSKSISDMCETALKEFRLPGDSETYTSHTIRRLAEEFASIAGSLWIASHISDLIHETAGKPLDGQVWANFLLDHEPGDGGISATYKSLKNSRVHEKWARMAALGVWEWVWEDNGARKAPDLTAIAAAEDHLATAVTDQRLAQARIGALKVQERSLEAEKASVFVEGPTNSMDDVVREIREVHRIDLRVRTVRMEQDDERETLARCNAAVEEATSACGEARQALVPLDDFLTTDEVETLRRQADEIAHSEADEGVEEGPRILRRDGDIRDFAWAIGMSESQARRYATKGSEWQMFFDDAPNSPYPKGVERPTERRTVIRFDELPLHRYPSEVVERLRWLMTQERNVKLPGVDAPSAS
jgi:hypothetical protein